MQALRIAILGLGLALATSPAAAATVNVNQHVEYYDVRGSTQEAIAQSLLNDAPQSLDGFQGQANFTFHWNYDYREAPDAGADKCQVVGARVKIDIVISLPRHRTISRAPDELEAVWRSYADAMERHERNHAKDFVAIGAQLPGALNQVIAPCDSIEDAANAKGMEYVDLAQKAADDYDRETNHGETEGTVFPGL